MSKGKKKRSVGDFKKTALVPIGVDDLYADTSSIREVQKHSTKIAAEGGRIEAITKQVEEALNDSRDNLIVFNREMTKLKREVFLAELNDEDAESLRSKETRLAKQISEIEASIADHEDTLKNAAEESDNLSQKAFKFLFDNSIRDKDGDTLEGDASSVNLDKQAEISNAYVEAMANLGKSRLSKRGSR